MVRPGDTLWDIAAESLGSADRARVARYWPRIHRANRAVIGPNPGFLVPGTVLFLPREEVQ
ncbi:MAG: LysM peptidoglycan-binding domain-containing protein [Actinomycetota bacterium]